MIVFQGVGADLDLHLFGGGKDSQCLVVEFEAGGENSCGVGVNEIGNAGCVSESVDPGLDGDFLPAAGNLRLAERSSVFAGVLDGDGYRHRKHFALGIDVVLVHQGVLIGEGAVDVLLDGPCPGIEGADGCLAVDIGVDAVVELGVHGVEIGFLQAVDEGFADGVHPGVRKGVVEENLVDGVYVGFCVKGIPQGAGDFVADGACQGIYVDFLGVLAVFAIFTVCAVDTVAAVVAGTCGKGNCSCEYENDAGNFCQTFKKRNSH